LQYRRFLTTPHFRPRLNGQPIAKLSSVQPSDRWPHAANATEYCLNYLRDASTSVWLGFNMSVVELEAQRQLAHGWPADTIHSVHTRESLPAFERCLHVQYSRLRFGGLDFLVLLFATVILCISITSERQQQLCNVHLRRALHGPLHQSWQACCIKVIELCVPAILPLIPCAMVTLVLTSGMDAINIVLNAVALGFVLLLDDELPQVMIARSDQNAMQHFACTALTTPSLNKIRMKGWACGVLAFIQTYMSFIFALDSTCTHVVAFPMYVCFLCILVTPVVEILCAWERRDSCRAQLLEMSVAVCEASFTVCFLLLMMNLGSLAQIDEAYVGGLTGDN